MDDQSSIVTTTTRIALASLPLNDAPPVTSVQHTSKEGEEEEDWIRRTVETTDRLNKALERTVRMQEAEIERLQRYCRFNTHVNVIMYQNVRKGDLSLSLITNTSPEGKEMFNLTRQKFQEHKDELHRLGVGFAFFDEVPVNVVHDLPFSG